MNKKADISTQVFGRLAIFVVIVLLMLSYWVYVQTLLTSSGASSIDRQVCKFSVEKQATTRGTAGNIVQLTNQQKSIVDINCPRYTVNFYDNKATIESVDMDEQKYQIPYQGDVITKFDELNSDMVNYVVSNEIRLCWYQFHEGKLDILNKAAWDTFDNEKVCFICNEIVFDHESLGTGTKFDGFWEYIHEVPNPEMEQTVYKYLADDNHICADVYKGDPTCFESYAREEQKRGDPSDRNPIDLNLTFEVGKRYVVFLVRQGIADFNQSTIFTYVIESDKLHDQCDQYIA